MQVMRNNDHYLDKLAFVLFCVAGISYCTSSYEVCFFFISGRPGGVLALPPYEQIFPLP